MAKKNWIVCLECDKLINCKAGKIRTLNVNVQSKIYNDIGCFNQEQYILQISDKQLKLF